MSLQSFSLEFQSRRSRPLAPLLLAVLVFWRGGAVLASEWILYSPRAVSLGGAYSALATGPDALLWNPAGLSYPSRLGFAFSRSGFLDDSSGMEDQLEPLRRINPEDPFLYGSPGRTGELVDQLFDLDGVAARDFEQTSFVLAGDKWALGYGSSDNWLLTAVADEDRTLAAPPEEAGSIALNQTSVDAYSLHLRRYTAALAFLTPQDPFTIGFALHYHRGGVRFARTRVFDLPDADPEKLVRVADEAPQDQRDDWSCDIGLLVPTKRMRIAVVARNLFFDKFPTLDPPAGVQEELGPGPQIRVGVAYVAGQNQLAAVDLDVTNNRVLGAERKTRAISVGYERSLAPWLVVRSGTSRSFDDDLGFIFALGTAVRLPFLSLELGGRINRNGGFDEIVGGATVTF